jgi:(p)ppGpp synthase/HD superfamily hydrolase
MKFTQRLELAIRKATVAHAEQKRKGGDWPYIIHPFSVMCIASEVTDDEDILIACLLHDVIEDVPERYSEADMLQDFGERVMDIVKGVTKDSSLPAWQDRADAYLAHMRIASIESVTVSAADKIHNLMSVLQDYEELGDKLWARFNAGKERQQWWYREVLKVLKSRIPDSPLTAQLEEEVLVLEGLH